MNPLMQVLMNQLKMTNLNGFNFVNNIMQNGGNPDEIAKQIMGNMNPQQRQFIINRAKGYGCPDNYINQIKNS